MNLTPIIDAVEKQLPLWLSRQRWFSKTDEPPGSATIIQHDLLRDAWPKLMWTLVETDEGIAYQVPLGIRQREHIGAVLLGYEAAHIGDFNVEGEDLVVYDALIDSVLGRVLFDVISDGAQEVKSMRPVGAEQSNTSLIFDNRFILKVFRRLYEGVNPDLDVNVKLGEAGFENIAPVVAKWSRGNHDLAMCQPYLFDGTEGWKLALASVRDFLGADTTGASGTVGSAAVPLDKDDPAAAGGDFADEARRLGVVTGELHLAMAQTFGTSSLEVDAVISSLEGGMDVVGEAQRPALQQLVEELRCLDPSKAGPATRIHGDYHLGQTLRSASGWYIFDFEGEPARPMDERTIPTSPLKDVAGMIRSFHYAALTGLRGQGSDATPNHARNALAWERRNREAFEAGYLEVQGIDEVLPIGSQARELVSRAFEVEKAIYELQYEKSYRPDWIEIPQSALERLLG